MSAIVVRGLTKKFRKNIVLDDFNLEVYNGEIFSLMGLENSGKTTLVRLLFRFLKPNRGSISVFDMDALKDTKMVKEFCGYVPEDVWIYENLKPISIFKKTLGLRNLKNMDDIHFLMDYFDLDNKKKFLDLSNSERKIVAIINALIAKPKLLILDEPTKYLSHGLIEKLFTHLRQLQTNEDLSILLLTSSLSVGQRYGDRAAYISKGRIVDLEFIKNKETNDKVFRIYDDIVPVASLESIGAKLLREDQGESEFFYNGYLPTLTTILYQERVKNFTLEDAILENKIKSYDSISNVNTDMDSSLNKETQGIEILEESSTLETDKVDFEEETTNLKPVEKEDVSQLDSKMDQQSITNDETIVVGKVNKKENSTTKLEDLEEKEKEENILLEKSSLKKFSTSWLGDTHTDSSKESTKIIEKISEDSQNYEIDKRG